MASAAIGLVVLRVVESQPVAFFAWLVAVLVGPVIVALVAGRPPALLFLVLLPVYFVVVALFANGHDESRWNSSRMAPAVFFLATQLIGVAVVVAMRSAAATSG